MHPFSVCVGEYWWVVNSPIHTPGAPSTTSTPQRTQFPITYIAEADEAEVRRPHHTPCSHSRPPCPHHVHNLCTPHRSDPPFTSRRQSRRRRALFPTHHAHLHGTRCLIHLEIQGLTTPRRFRQHRGWPSVHALPCTEDVHLGTRQDTRTDGHRAWTCV